MLKSINVLFLILLIQIWLPFSLQTKDSIQDYNVDYQSTKLKTIINLQTRQLFVDIGAYDPIFQSKTLQLYLSGWDGINVQPNHLRIKNFYQHRPQSINLNLAIGQSNKFITLTHADPTQKQKISNQSLIYSISLKDLCQKYYQKQPKIINIGLSQVEMINKIMQNNNWQNRKCKPDIFIFKATNIINQPNQPKKIENYEIILTQKLYTKFNYIWEGTQIYIRNEVKEQYQMIFQSKRSLNIDKRIIKFQTAIDDISTIIRKPINLGPFSKTSNLLFVKQNQKLILNKIVEQHQRNYKKGFPIIICNFNSIKNSLILDQCNFFINRLINDKVSVLNLTIMTNATKNQTQQIYFLDQNPQPYTIKPKLIILNSKCVKNAIGGQYISTNLQNGEKIPFKNQISLNDFIFEIIFTIVFLLSFFVLNIIVIVFFCKKNKKQYKIKKQKQHNVQISVHHFKQQINTNQ